MTHQPLTHLRNSITYAVRRAKKLIAENPPGMSASELVDLLEGDLGELEDSIEDTGEHQ